jgi:hypothetical protein
LCPLESISPRSPASAYVSIRQHTSASVSISALLRSFVARFDIAALACACARIGQLA